MAFKKLGNLLPRHLQQAGLSQPVQAALMLETANKKLEELFGADMVRHHARAVAVKFGRLQIASVDASLRHAISMHAEEIKDAVNQQAGKNQIKQIQIII